MKAKLLMIQGTSSGSGKSTIATAFCRIFSDEGYNVVPFKAQNMSSNIHTIPKTSRRIAQAQAIQALASRKFPDTRMNPILLKPCGNDKSDLILAGTFHSQISARMYYDKFVLQKGFPLVLESLDCLRKENDIVVIEGAGSPAEVNISKYDIANMLLAERVSAPVIIVADIERGGCFASIVGTMKLLNSQQRDLIKGFIINKFRGDETILFSAIKSIERMIGKEILGVIPKIHLSLPDEDSLDSSKSNEIKFSKKSVNSQVNFVAKVIRNRIDIQKVMMDIVGIST